MITHPLDPARLTHRIGLGALCWMVGLENGEQRARRSSSRLRTALPEGKLSVLEGEGLEI